MQFRNLFLLALALSTLCCFAQQPAAQAAPSAVDNNFVQKEFGSSCSLLPGPVPQIADLDGDGVADIVIAGHCTNPLIDQAQHSFEVIDPYYSYLGYSDPKITTQFATEEPEMRGIVLLIIHGAGPDAWRAAAPKAKFVIVNLPYKQIMVKKLEFKKKVVMGIYAEESGENKTVSVTFWDGKRYRYQPLGSAMD
jgi:hypothetical protein